MPNPSKPTDITFSLTLAGKSIFFPLGLIAICSFTTFICVMLYTALLSPQFEGKAVFIVDHRNRDIQQVSTRIRQIGLIEAKRKCLVREQYGVVEINCKGETPALVSARLKEVLDVSLAGWSDERFVQALASLKTIRESFHSAEREANKSSRGLVNNNDFSKANLESPEKIVLLAELTQLQQAVILSKISLLERSLADTIQFPPVIVQTPTVLPDPVRPRWIRNAIVGLALGLLLGVVFVLMSSIRRDRRP